MNMHFKLGTYTLQVMKRFITYHRKQKSFAEWKLIVQFIMIRQPGGLSR